MSASPAIAALGHNNPPEPTPFDLSCDEIEGLYMEAKHWLDGAGITTQADADAIGKLLALTREATKRADERRVAENKPFDDGKAKVQARYNPLIGNTKSVKGKAVLAAECCQRALAPFLAAQEAEKRAKAEAARVEALRAAEAATAAFQASRVDDLTAREQAEALAWDAKAAETAANRAEADKARVAGGARAVTLRTTYRAEVTDRRAFLNWVATTRPDELTGMLQGLAERLCAATVRGLPGVTYHEERRAV